jgi:hypothetical protein
VHVYTKMDSTRLGEAGSVPVVWDRLDGQDGRGPLYRTSALAQPSMGSVAHVLHAALADRAFTRLDVAVAYVTTSGIKRLRDSDGAQLDRLNRRWLSSFDWCRSQPVALAALNQTAASSVRIHDGAYVVARQGCAPRLPFHAKGFLFSGDEARLLISGSGNLSDNGISRGVELDTALEVRSPTSPIETALWDELGKLQAWFDGQWALANPYQDDLRARYEAAYSVALKTPAPTDDDWAPVATPRGFTPMQLAGARRATTFWIEAGNLTPNLGAGVPGSQLMMRAMTRVFFGVSATVVPVKTPLGSVDIRYGGMIYANETLEYAHNGMDRLNLPHPGLGGPPAYDQQTLVFRKIPYEGRVIYELTFAATRTQRTALRKASAAVHLDLVMPGGRRFGFSLA